MKTSSERFNPPLIVLRVVLVNWQTLENETSSWLVIRLYWATDELLLQLLQRSIDFYCSIFSEKLCFEAHYLLDDISYIW